jgi:HEPN domain-containing protein
LNYLIDLLTEINIRIPDADKIITDMSEYAVNTRYPGDYEPLALEDFNNALHLAEKIIEFVKNEFQVKRLF